VLAKAAAGPGDEGDGSGRWYDSCQGGGHRLDTSRPDHCIVPFKLDK
jgi:hypothetical protein